MIKRAPEMCIDDWKKMQSDLRNAKKALKLAYWIMDYCGGDKWERECTAEDRKKFHKLYDKIMGD